MSRLNEEQINNIRAHSDIVDVISRYVPLTHKGKNYLCACPFHDDHNPSLSINPDKQIFKCFVCGTGGNVFTFVSKYEHISFVEAVYKVAEYAGIQMEHKMLTSKAVDPKKAPLYKAIQDMIEFTHYELQSEASKSVKEYLSKRGLNDTLIEKFEIGYNPKDDAVYKFLHAKKHEDSSLIEANLVRTTAIGIKDVFSNRITIPIHDAYGNPVGFSARRIVDHEDEAKYINTSETIIYTKGNLIYNYHRAKPEVKAHKKVFLVEGAMDVIAFAKADIYHVVATLGTACTKEQLKLLKAFNVPLVLCYDGDRAGRDATYKFGKAAMDYSLNFEIVENERGLDPDDIIELYGKEALQSMSEKTLSWIDFLFDYLTQKYNLDNYTQKKEFAQELSKEINRNLDDFEKQSYYLRLKELTGFNMTMNQNIENQPKPNSHKNSNYIRIPKMGEYHAQQEIISQMLLGLVASNYFKDELGFLPDPICNKLAIYIIDYYRNHKSIQVADLLDFIKEENVKTLLLEIIDWELGRDEINMEVLGGAITKVKSCLLDKKIAKFNETIAKTKDPIEKAKMADEKNRLIQEKRGMLYEED
ncbi:MAG: DNA primase [Erysipelotrichaceae bacterium]